MNGSDLDVVGSTNTTIVKKNQAGVITVDSMTMQDVKKFINPHVTEQELVFFFNQCKLFNLNPFKREIYLVKYGTQPAQSIMSYEVFLKRAQRSGTLDGWKIEAEKNDKSKLYAKLTVYRKDWKHPFEHTAYYDEAVQLKKDGNINKIWKKMPVFMTKKVCISQGFRMCFTDELGGLPYTDAEIIPEENLTNNSLEVIESKVAIVNGNNGSDNGNNGNGNKPVLTALQKKKLIRDYIFKNSNKEKELAVEMFSNIVVYAFAKYPNTFPKKYGHLDEIPEDKLILFKNATVEFFKTMGGDNNNGSDKTKSKQKQANNENVSFI